MRRFRFGCHRLDCRCGLALHYLLVHSRMTTMRLLMYDGVEHPTLPLIDLDLPLLRVPAPEVLHAVINDPFVRLLGLHSSLTPFGLQRGHSSFFEVLGFRTLSAAMSLSKSIPKMFFVSIMSEENVLLVQEYYIWCIQIVCQFRGVRGEMRVNHQIEKRFAFLLRLNFWSFAKNRAPPLIHRRQIFGVKLLTVSVNWLTASRIWRF